MKNFRAETPRRGMSESNSDLGAILSRLAKPQAIDLTVLEHRC